MSTIEDVAETRPSTSLRVLRPRRAAPDHAVRPTRAEIDLSALRHNLRVVQRAAGRARTWAVLKADGYGHGAPAVARTLERAGVDGLAVALLEEAIELRDAGIRAPILVMGGYYGDAYEEVLAHDLVPVVYHPSHFEALSRAMRVRGLERQKPLAVHIKIDTGMARLGCSLADVEGLLQAAAAFPTIAIDGVMTHFACADAGEAEVAHGALQEQLRRFSIGVAQIRRAGHTPTYLHASNSAAMMRAARASTFRAGEIDPRLDAVRPGILLFGTDPTANDTIGLDPTKQSPFGALQSTLRMRSEIVALRTLEVGDTVGYGATWKAARPTTIATVPMGYADGLPRSLSNPSSHTHGHPGSKAGTMLVRGKRAPIVGAISMDLCTLDVTDIAGAHLRDEVVALGEQRGVLGTDRLTVDEVASAAGLIAWDVLTSISRRVPRFYREP